MKAQQIRNKLKSSFLNWINDYSKQTLNEESEEQIPSPQSEFQILQSELSSINEFFADSKGVSGFLHIMQHSPYHGLIERDALTPDEKEVLKSASTDRERVIQFLQLGNSYTHRMAGLTILKHSSPAQNINFYIGYRSDWIVNNKLSRYMFLAIVTDHQRYETHTFTFSNIELQYLMQLHNPERCVKVFPHFRKSDTSGFIPVISDWDYFHDPIMSIPGSIWEWLKVNAIHEMTSKNIPIPPSFIKFADDVLDRKKRFITNIHGTVHIG